MCGIAGFVNPNIDAKLNINTMLDRIKHRGPDGSGVWMDPCDTGVVLGHRRLSIIDLSENGSQPMISHSRRYVISYNGEIYNHSYLLNKMRLDGYSDQMRGSSDTEILVEAIDFYGPDKAIGLCKGMFAIAIYDRQEETLMLIRDRIGEKPLYYGMVAGGFAFASELGALKTMQGFDNALNTDILGIYLTYGYIPAPYSIYKKIWKLEAGTCLKIKCRINKAPVAEPLAHGLELDAYSPEYITYWSLIDTAFKGQSNLFRGSREEAAEELESLLKASIKDQMVADVPLGAFLSAGIDSTTVVSLMQSLSDKPIRTFTIGFDQKGYNEAESAKIIAKHLGTDHTEQYVTKQDALDAVPIMADMFDEPFADSSQIPTYFVSRMAKEHVTVSLSGDGGDELFGGYSTYASLEGMWNKFGRIPRALRHAGGSLMQLAPAHETKGYRLNNRGNLLRAESPADLYRRSFQPDGLVRKLTDECRGLPYKYSDLDHCRKLDTYHSAMLMDMEMYHPDDILVKVDRSAMSVSLESRVPMLDRDLVEFAWTLPTEYLRCGGVGKQVLRDVLYKYVPKEIMDRPKTGFSIPIMEWLREPELGDWAENLLNPELIKDQGLLDCRLVEECWKDYKERGIWRRQIWNILMLNAWMEKQKI